MALKLMYITNNPIVAKAAEKSGVDWVFIDLEVLGKELRQANMDTVKSKHNIADIIKIKSVISESKIIVRINPFYEGSEIEINQSISFGADILMLPYFKTYNEVERFLSIVNQRVETCLLLETPEAVNILDQIILDRRINYIHLGLNDLHLGYHKNFMFQLISDGTVEYIVNKIRTTKIIYGFGGIAGLSEGDLPAEYIITEHYRLKSQLVILSRSFYRQSGQEEDELFIVNIMKTKIDQIREFENKVLMFNSKQFDDNKRIIDLKVKEIVSRRKN